MPLERQTAERYDSCREYKEAVGENVRHVHIEMKEVSMKVRI